MTDQTQTSRHEVDSDGRHLAISLEEAARLDPAAARALLGSKAASLARLTGAGFPVPAGVAGKLEQQLQQQADVVVHGGGHRLGDGRDDLGRGPVTGLAVNATPAASAATIAWTRTAIPDSDGSSAAATVAPACGWACR